MNKIFKTVWNSVRRCLVVVNEATKSASQRGSTSGSFTDERASFTVETSKKPLKGTFFSFNPIFLACTLAFASPLVLAADKGFWFGTHETWTGNTNYGTIDMYPGSQLKVDGGGDNLGSDVDAYIPYVENNEAWRSTVKIEGGTHIADTLKINGGLIRMNIPGHSNWRYYTTHNVVTLNSGTLRTNTTQMNGTFEQYGGTSHLGNVTLTTAVGKRNSQRRSGNIDLHNGSLNINSLISDASDQAYNQSGGNAYIGSFSGAGKINLSGGTLTFGTLSSGSSVNATGGTIIANDMALTSRTLSARNTRLETAFSEVGNLSSKNQEVEKLNISANGNDNGIGKIDAGVFGQVQTFSGLHSAFTNNVSWSGGSMHFKGTFNQSVASAITNAVHQAFGSSVAVSFERIQDDAYQVGEGVTTDRINQLMAATGHQELILYTMVWDAKGQEQVVGLETNANSIGQTIGFKFIKNANNVNIKDGKTLVLLGETLATKIADGTFNVDNGTLRLGTESNQVAKGGQVDIVVLSNNGQFIAQGGSFAGNSVTGSGDVFVKSNANLSLTQLDVEGDLNVESGTLNLANNATISGGQNAGQVNAKGLTINESFINTGSTKVEGQLAFGENGRFNQTSGTLTTHQDNLFENVNFSVQDGLNTISLNSTVPEEVKTSLSDFFQKYVPGNLTQEIIDHASFAGGKVVITGVNLTTTMRDDLTQAFKDTFRSSIKRKLSNVFSLYIRH